MIRLLKYLLISSAVLMTACRQSPLSPLLADKAAFHFKVNVTNLTNKPLEGLQVKVRFEDNSSGTTEWVVPYFWKITCTADGAGADSTRWRDSIYAIHQASGESNSDMLGATGIDGSFQTDDSLLFPVALSQLDGDTIRYTNESNNLVSMMTVNKACRIMVSIRDPLNGTTETHYEILRRGSNEYRYVLVQNAPADGSTTLAKSGPEQGTAATESAGMPWMTRLPLTHASEKFTSPNLYPATWSNISFADAHNNYGSLYYGPPDSTIDLGYYELPPPGPEFDVRFASNRAVELANDTAVAEFPIQLMSSPAGYPIHVSWSPQANPAVAAFLNIGGNEVPLFSGDTTATISAPVFTLFLKLLPPGWGPYIPTAGTVTSCYPNPTSGATKFDVAVPLRSHVVVKVTDLRGESARTIVDQTFNPGYHTVVLQTDDLSPETR